MCDGIDGRRVLNRSQIFVVVRYVGSQGAAMQVHERVRNLCRPRFAWNMCTFVDSARATEPSEPPNSIRRSRRLSQCLLVLSSSLRCTICLLRRGLKFDIRKS